MAWARRAGVGLGALAVIGGLVWALWPQPLPVDLAQVTRGPMQGTISAQGVTRVREPYAITAPITGTVGRLPVEVGDRVTAGETLVAILRPADPGLMDARSRAQAEAAVAEAQAAVSVAETDLRQAQMAEAHAQSQAERARALADRGTIARRMVEDIEAEAEAMRQNVTAAQSRLELNRAALARAQAQLMGPEAILDPATAPDDCCLRLFSPQTGIVLSVVDQSARLVQAGSPLLTVGNLDEMEIEVDLLSSDAVQLPADARGVVDRWGGVGELDVRLRRVDPAAFTRVSALGIEEQRVRLRLDLLAPPEARVGLGDAFRVHLRLILWEEGDLLRVPQAALFRQGEGWAVFVADAGRARLTPVQIGRQAEGLAEVLNGLTDGVSVVLFPPGGLRDGLSVVERGH
jgi:HlyD family secretion protein